MCLGVVGRIESVDGMVAQVDFWGVRRGVRLDVVDVPVSPGDYVMNHAGYAIRRIPPAEVQATLELYDELLRLAARNDLMAADIRNEVRATSKRGAR